MIRTKRYHRACRLRQLIILLLIWIGGYVAADCQALPPGWGQDTTIGQQAVPEAQTSTMEQVPPVNPSTQIPVQPVPSPQTAPTTDVPGLQDPPVRPTGVTEDMGKYMGFENILERYVSLPYDAIMNTNLGESFVHLGYLLLLFLPLILLFRGGTSPVINLLVMALLAALLVVSAGSSYVQRNNISPDQAIPTIEQQKQTSSGKPLEELGHLLRKPLLAAYTPVGETMNRVSGPRDGITYPVLCGIFFILLFLAEHRLRERPLILRTFVHFTLLYTFLWLILSSGIPWYGLLMLPLGYLFIVRGIVRDGGWKGNGQRLRVGLLLTFVLVWLIMFFPSRFCGFFPISEISAKMPFSVSISQYQVGR
ncbi:MAG: hypothetical protein R3330_09910, partial [Saprospiraceae bacterium]|nr:hypothetical protein [Saprospiraceae bacterium]